MPASRGRGRAASTCPTRARRRRATRRTPARTPGRCAACAATRTSRIRIGAARPPHAADQGSPTARRTGTRRGATRHSQKSSDAPSTRQSPSEIALEVDATDGGAVAGRMHAEHEQHREAAEPSSVVAAPCVCGRLRRPGRRVALSGGALRSSPPARERRRSWPCLPVGVWPLPSSRRAAFAAAGAFAAVLAVAAVVCGRSAVGLARPSPRRWLVEFMAAAGCHRGCRAAAACLPRGQQRERVLEREPVDLVAVGQRRVDVAV